MFTFICPNHKYMKLPRFVLLALKKHAHPLNQERTREKIGNANVTV